MGAKYANFVKDPNKLMQFEAKPRIVGGIYRERRNKTQLFSANNQNRERQIHQRRGLLVHLNIISLLDSPNRNVDQVALDTNEDLVRTQKLIESEFDKATRINEELNHKVNELTDGVSVINDRMDSFDQKINQIIELLNKKSIL